MSLIKSFNFKYLKENLKKSKGLIILLLIVVPLLTTLFTVLFINGEDVPNLATEIGINWVNLIGMYLVPLGISFALFGYVYKKNSVDLINSMPLNKQTIFVTNTIGGIILITLMQLVTSVLLLACGLVCSNLVVFSKMIFDIFIKMWVGYVFIFTATNLAMTISGTFLTQLVLTALILFLVPFTSMNFKGYLYETRYKIYVDALEKQYTYAYATDTYTTPIQIPIDFIIGNTFSGKTLLKSTLLGALYIALGVILFKRRKMENNEESFKDTRIHLLVKALTVFPMIVFLSRLDPGEVLTIFILALIAIYYFAYDFIVRRKVKLIASIGALILTVCVSYGVQLGIEKFETDVFDPSRTISVNDIRKVAINLDSAVSFNYVKDYEIDNYFLDNEEIIKLLINNIERKAELSYETEDIVNTELTHSIKVIYVTKNGKELYGHTDITESNFNKLIEILSNDEEYVRRVKRQYTSNGRISLEKQILPKDIENAVNQELKRVIDNMSLQEVYDKVMCDSEGYYSDISKVYYNNHKLSEKEFNIGVSEELAKIIIKYQNASTVNWLKGKNLNNIDTRLVGTIYYGENANKVNDYTYYDTSFYKYKKEIIKFAEDNANEEVNPNKEFYQIYYYDYNSRIPQIFYTNKIDEINSLIEKEHTSGRYNNYSNYDYDVELNEVY